jgi:hypothetical protein
LITGAHIIIYSKDPEADRAFFRDVFKLSHVDVGAHEVWFLCNNLDSFVAEMTAHKLTCDPAEEQSWGRINSPDSRRRGQGRNYEPRHARPKPMNG